MAMCGCGAARDGSGKRTKVCPKHYKQGYRIGRKNPISRGKK